MQLDNTQQYKLIYFYFNNLNSFNIKKTVLKSFLIALTMLIPVMAHGQAVTKLSHVDFPYSIERTLIREYVASTTPQILGSISYHESLLLKYGDTPESYNIEVDCEYLPNKKGIFHEKTCCIRFYRFYRNTDS